MTREIKPIQGYTLVAPEDIDAHGENTAPILLEGYSNADAVSGSPNDQLNVKVTIDTRAIKTINDSDAGTLDITLRELEYCDKDGNEFKIVVLASQPIEKDD